MFEERSVTRGFRVMKLVDDHDVKGVGSRSLKPCRRERLDHGEHLPPDARPLASAE